MEARGQLSIQPRHHCCQDLASVKAAGDGLRLISPRFVRVESLVLAWKCLVRQLFGVQIFAARRIKMWRFRRDGNSVPRLSPKEVVTPRVLASQRHVAGKTGRAVVCRDSLRVVRFQGLLAAFSFSGRLFSPGGRASGALTSG